MMTGLGIAIYAVSLLAAFLIGGGVGFVLGAVGATNAALAEQERLRAARQEVKP